jgi:hypothetical protein
MQLLYSSWFCLKLEAIRLLDKQRLKVAMDKNKLKLEKEK